MIKKNTHYSIYFILLLLLGLLYYFYDPALYQLFPSCVFKTVTGLDCPGCGAQRATHELLHLRFKNAFAYNTLLVIFLPYALTALLFYQTTLKDKMPKTRKFLFGKNSMIIIFIVVIAFFIFRNL